jgi:hypothetical protein
MLGIRLAMWTESEEYKAEVRRLGLEGSITGQQAEKESDINELKFVYICDSTCSAIWVDKEIDLAKTYCSDCFRPFNAWKDAKK